MTLSLGTILGACGAVWMAAPSRAPKAPPPVCVAPPSPAPAVVPVAAVAAAPVDENLGDADPPLFPSDDNPEARSLAHMLAHWATDPTEAGPALDYRRGVLFVESGEDRGDDGPYPRSVAPEAIHACGTQATWMRSDLRESLRYLDLHCSATSCTFGGMEYAPSGELVFRHVTGADRERWVLVSWSQAYVSSLGEEEATANRRFVTASLKRLANARCPGEPAGYYD